MGLDILPLKPRLIRVGLDTEKTEILVTSLLDPKAYPTDILMELYHKQRPADQFAQALSKVKNIIVLLFNRRGESVANLISTLHEILIRTTATHMIYYILLFQIPLLGK